jgi:hypothetical protein
MASAWVGGAACSGRKEFIKRDPAFAPRPGISDVEADTGAPHEIWGCRRTLGGPMPAADVDLTLMIREGQNSVGAEHSSPGRRLSRVVIPPPVVRALENILMRSGGVGGRLAALCPRPRSPTPNAS